jgi:hypothetical protein
MLSLQKTSDLAKHELESDLYLLELLREDLVNISALSRMLLPRIRKENRQATVESISIAIKRYIDQQKAERISERLRVIIGNTQLSTKNDIIHMTFRRNQEVARQISKVSERINWDNDEIFLVNQGSGEITVVLDKKNRKLLDQCRQHMVECTADVAIISLKESFQKESLEVPGLYAYFINQLARNGINLVEVVSTLSQLTFVLRENDMPRAYTIFNEKIKYFRRRKQ